MAKTSRHVARLALALVVAIPANLVCARTALSQQMAPSPTFQGNSFSSWRPYKNPNRLVSVGMNKGEVFAIAGKPDHEESYYQSMPGRLIRISDWYYTRSDHNPETTLLKFVQ